MTRALPHCGSPDRPEGGRDRHRVLREDRVDDQWVFIYRALEARSTAGQGPRHGAYSRYRLRSGPHNKV